MKRRRVNAVCMLVFVLALVLPAVAQAGSDAAPSPRDVRVSVMREFDTTLDPGVWHGYVLGASATNRAYILEITPLEPAREGAYVERNVVQAEYSGTWNDVLRLQTSAAFSRLRVNVRVYALTPRA